MPPNVTAATAAAAPAAQSPSPARTVKLAPLVALIFFSVSGGAYGIEGLFSTAGPGIRPYRVPGGPVGLSLVALSLTGVCCWAAWQQYTENGTKAVTYCLIAVGACALLYPPIAKRRRRIAGAEA